MLLYNKTMGFMRYIMKFYSMIKVLNLKKKGKKAQKRDRYCGHRLLIFALLSICIHISQQQLQLWPHHRCFESCCCRELGDGIMSFIMAACLDTGSLPEQKILFEQTLSLHEACLEVLHPKSPLSFIGYYDSAMKIKNFKLHLKESVSVSI